MSDETLYEQLEREFHCDHADVECRRRLLHNTGTGGWVEHVWRQCPGCGKGFGAVGKEGMTPATIRTLPAYDEQLQQAMTERRMARLRELQNTARTAESAAWWEAYDAYMQTPQWRRKRAKVLERDRHICQSCREAPAVQAHHTTYKHLFDEPLFELQAVCISCHERLHGRSLSMQEVGR